MTRSALLSVLLLASCAQPPEPGPVPVKASPQREGDPVKGWDSLVNYGYVSCGIPWSAYSRVTSPAPESARVPGRNALNETLSYGYTTFKTKAGIQLVSANCLSCHASYLFGKLTVGLGNPNMDFTFDTLGPAALSEGLVSDPAEKVEWQRWFDRFKAVAPAMRMNTVGLNPADNLAVILPSHRDRETLAWSNKLLMSVPVREQPIGVDVPAWWHMKKKTTMFMTGFGRGDHSRLMMSASMLCTDSVEEAAEIDAQFPDIRAYLMSIPPPRYPFQIDQELAARGKETFESTCSRCHGTYGENPTYPNVAVPLEIVGTDGRLSEGANAQGGPYIDWFNASFYGEVSELVYTDGYIAPPLDGVWATAPFFHNQSVPTLETVLNSAARPKFFTRSFRSELEDFDATEVGWRYTVLDHGKADEPDLAKKRAIYDTTIPGYSNQGHTFGDALTTEERAAVIEYLKTL